MSLSHLETIRNLLDEGATEPANCEPLLPRISGIRTVVFDVYGTLLSSGCCKKHPRAESIVDRLLPAILEGHELALPETSHSLADSIEVLIAREHRTAKARGISYPEIDIRSIWSELLQHPVGHAIEDIAVRYECMTNPVWPMAGARELIAVLKKKQLSLGIVSNAQFYTPLLFPALMEATLPDLGFTESLCVFSYQHGHAKPGNDLYRILTEKLAQQSISPAHVLYIGNDALKDIHPAAKAGFRTVLFAGDADSLKRHPEKTGLLPPDAVITHLQQILYLLS